MLYILCDPVFFWGNVCTSLKIKCDQNHTNWGMVLYMPSGPSLERKDFQILHGYTFDNEQLSRHMYAVTYQ